MQTIFGTDGIRGKFGKEITYSLAYKIGYSLALNLDNKNPIIIGRDTRISGDILLEAISKGIEANGKEYISIGICPTPAIPFLVRKEKFSCGIMISASHNPPDYNGIKFFDSKGKKISKEFENRIEKTVFKANEKILVPQKSISIKTNKHFINEYKKSLIKTMGDENLEGMKIILDACHGSASTCAKDVFNSLGASVTVINNDKNGLKINLNCGSTCLKPLIEVVKEKNADMGFSFDGDADRVIGVDSEGKVLDGDHILFLWGKELMTQNLLTNNLLISTQMANLGLENAWDEIGGTFYRTEVGDKYIYEAIMKKKAVLGGEQSGHILSKINNFSGDGILTALQISKYCKKKNISLQNWLKSSFKPYPQKLTNINLEFNIKQIKKREKDRIDQVIKEHSRNFSGNYRIFIRPSGTEPLMRVLVEAENQEKVDFLSKQISAKITSEIKKISIDI